jgi:hypothetical protein
MIFEVLAVHLRAVAGVVPRLMQRVKSGAAPGSLLFQLKRLLQWLFAVQLRAVVAVAGMVRRCMDRVQQVRHIL